MDETEKEVRGGGGTEFIWGGVRVCVKLLSAIS